MASRNETTTGRRWETFQRNRRRLIRIAGRLLGSADDAEDLVQEAALRWLKTDLTSVRNPEGWLIAVVTHLAVDRLRRTSVERRAYREMRHAAEHDDVHRAVTDQAVERTAGLANAFALLRERLEPTERTALVLREMFDSSYDDIARVVAKSDVACRQIVHRARERLQGARLELAFRCEGSPPLERAFVDAVAAGDREAVVAALTAPPAEYRHRRRRATSAPMRWSASVVPQCGSVAPASPSNVPHLFVLARGPAYSGRVPGKPRPLRHPRRVAQRQSATEEGPATALPPRE
jgi:RNA polymerase sigma factor (sigma-70 family)